MKSILVDEFDTAQRKLGTLLPRKWTTLYYAREHVLFAHIKRWRSREEFDDLVNVLRGRPTATMFGGFFHVFDRSVQSFLVRAFGEGHIKTRGIEHRDGLEQVMLDPLPWNWWKRIVDRDDTVRPNDGFPVHVLSWLDSSISRCSSGDGERLVTITDIEVDQRDLFKVVKPIRRGPSPSGAEGR